MTNRETLEFLRQNDNFLILNHRRPDGDAVGSAAALCRGLRAMGKTAYIWKNPQNLGRYMGYTEGLEIETEPEGAVIVSVDLSTEGLLPLNGEHFAGRIRLCIDHHPSNEGYAAFNNVQPDKAACGEIILELVQELGVLDAQMAEALYVAISTDTGCFQYSNVTASTLRAAADLKDAGVDTYPINKAIFGTKSIARLRLEAALTASAEFYAGGEVCVCTLTRALMDELKVSEDDLDSISGFPREIEGVKIGVMARELREGGAKLSLRTEDPYNASELCAALGGGGHRAAAGASDPDGLDSAKKRILQVISDSGVAL